jgi:hypothetical protein
MSKPTNVIDESDPNANMYGCLPCPRCRSTCRWPTQPFHPVYPNCILCDYCDFIEQAVRKDGAT